jgi:hypothetical protein
VVVKKAVGEWTAKLFVEEHEHESDPGSFVGALCANMTETPSVTAISEQGGKENTQHGNDERQCESRDTGDRDLRFGIG